MLSQNWYRRLLLSYFPIFLLTVSILIFLSFLVINEISRQETAKADRISTGYMMDTLERSVSEVELDILSDLETASVYPLFLNGNNVDNTAITYQTIDRLRMLENNSDVILYADRLLRSREKLNGIISDRTGQPKEKVEKDSDRDYFLTAEEAVAYGWWIRL